MIVAALLLAAFSILLLQMGRGARATVVGLLALLGGCLEIGTRLGWWLDTNLGLAAGLLGFSGILLILPWGRIAQPEQGRQAHIRIASGGKNGVILAVECPRESIVIESIDDLRGSRR